MATKTVTGRITQVTISADKWDDVKNSGAGFFFIYMNALPKASPDGFKRVAISKGTHSAFSEIVQVAMFAQSNQLKVKLAYLESNITRANSWDFAVLNVISTEPET